MMNNICLSLSLARNIMSKEEIVIESLKKQIAHLEKRMLSIKEKGKKDIEKKHLQMLLGKFLITRIHAHPEKLAEIKTDFLNYLKNDKDRAIAQRYFSRIEELELKQQKEGFENEGGQVIPPSL